MSAMALCNMGAVKAVDHTSSSAPVSSSELLSSSPMLTSCVGSALPLPFPSATVWAGFVSVPPAVGSALPWFEAIVEENGRLGIRGLVRVLRKCVSVSILESR